MGVYMVPELAAKGYSVKVVSLDEVQSDNPLITYAKANGKDRAFLEDELKEDYDGIIDFMLYPADEFDAVMDLFLTNCDHYFYLSSYRIYDGKDVPITEESRRLLDSSTDQDFLATDDYSLYKARGEDTLKNSAYKNWTAVRPAITYSKRRFQLTTLEAPDLVGRALQGLPVVLPEAAKNVQATMSWAGDVAKMFAGLLFNPEAMCECFTFATAEHHTWGEIAEYYQEIIGLKVVWANTNDYLKTRGGFKGCHPAWHQLAYDRLFERVVDNSKVLRVAGLKQQDFMPLKQGLERELLALPKDAWSTPTGAWEAMDAYLEEKKG
jgi:nucleoside-diphosphate-sugar epimerase